MIRVSCRTVLVETDLLKKFHCVGQHRRPAWAPRVLPTSYLTKALLDVQPAKEDTSKQLEVMDKPANQVTTEQLRQAHRVCLHMLLWGEAGFASRADSMTKTIDVEMPDSATVVQVHFDNKSHSSGYQRGYVLCCRHGRAPAGYPACFRYV